MSEIPRDLPILDSHIHLDPKGRPKEAVRSFVERGGSHLLVIHKPYHHIPLKDIDDQIRAFETTIEMTDLARDNGAQAWSIIGPYPGELPRLSGSLGFDNTIELMQASMDEALKMVRQGKALGIGEIGRVHFPVEKKFQDACDDLMVKAFKGAYELDCPVILHTESLHTNPDLMRHLSSLLDGTGMKKEKVVKHYSGPDLLSEKARLGMSISLQCRKASFKMALEQGADYLLETDYIDDPKRPNVVMPPDTVPKKIHWAYNSGLIDEEEHRRLMVYLPKRILGIDTM